MASPICTFQKSSKLYSCGQNRRWFLTFAIVCIQKYLDDFTSYTRWSKHPDRDVLGIKLFKNCSKSLIASLNFGYHGNSNKYNLYIHIPSETGRLRALVFDMCRCLVAPYKNCLNYALAMAQKYFCFHL